MSEQLALGGPTRLDGLRVPDLSRLVTARGFRDLVSRGAGDGAIVAKDIPAEITKAEGGGRRFKFTLTTGNPDRDSDVIDPTGLDFESYRRNPIWLWSHSTSGCGDDSHVALIGMAVDIRQMKNRTDVTVEYAPAEVNPLAESVVQMHLWRMGLKALEDRGGACSIGLLPVQYARNNERGGIDFLKSEVLEGSDCMIPANSECLMRMKSAGVELDPVMEWAETIRKAAGVVELDQERAKAIAETLDPTRGLSLFELGADRLRELGKGLREKAVEAGYEDPPAGLDLTRLEKGVCRALAPVEAKLDRMVAALERMAAVPAAPPAPSQEGGGSALDTASEEDVRRAVRRLVEREFVARTGQPLPPEKTS